MYVSVYSLCTTVVHNTAQHNTYENFPSYPPDNHHSSDDVYWREGHSTEETKTNTTKSKHSPVTQRHCSTKQTQKTKAKFSRLLRPLVWKEKALLLQPWTD